MWWHMQALSVKTLWVALKLHSCRPHILMYLLNQCRIISAGLVPIELRYCLQGICNPALPVLDSRGEANQIVMSLIIVPLSSTILWFVVSAPALYSQGIFTYMHFSSLFPWFQLYIITTLKVIKIWSWRRLQANKATTFNLPHACWSCWMTLQSMYCMLAQSTDS